MKTGIAAVVLLALPFGHPKPAPHPPQVTGAQLAAVLLPATAFGDGIVHEASLSSGRGLVRTDPATQVRNLSCNDYQARMQVSGFGNTAGAGERYEHPGWRNSYPEVIIGGYQTVMQFATVNSATSYYNQASQNYAKCVTFTEANPGDTVPGGGSFVFNTLSMTATGVDHDRGFTVVQSVAFSETPGATYYYADVLYVLAGTNVYEFWQLSGTNDAPSPNLMTQLIQRTQALYHHR